MMAVDQVVTVTEYEVDLDQGRVIADEREETIQVQVPTGGMVKQFSADWRFERGSLYRRPTLLDIDVDAILIETYRELPQWILDRVPRAGLQSASALRDEVQRRIASRLAGDSTTAIAEAESNSEAQTEVVLAGGGE